MPQIHKEKQDLKYYSYVDPEERHIPLFEDPLFWGTWLFLAAFATGFSIHAFIMYKSKIPW